ncbi:MAG: hypothetical protein HY758_08825, partial [Nitrospirae bacterium]|nr:hypothetical protein [Nitrospirota bacterium]
MILRNRKIRLLLLTLLACSLLGVSGSYSEEMQAGTAEITAINVQEVNNKTEIHIDSSSPFSSYTVYKDDPYRVAVEIQGASAGGFRDTITVDRGGVAEIV